MNFGICVARSGGWALTYSLDTRGNHIQGSQKLHEDFLLRGVWHPDTSIVQGSAIEERERGPLFLPLAWGISFPRCEQMCLPL